MMDDNELYYYYFFYLLVLIPVLGVTINLYFSIELENVLASL
jgi:hypothetical protein